jgi:hypothetical protein
VATKSVVTPLQWILLIVAAASVFGMIFIGDPLIRWGFFSLLVVDVGYTLFAYDHFRRSDPERLQSENYRHAQATLQNQLLLDDRHHDEPQILTVAPVANTAAPQIASSGTALGSESEGR